MLLNIFYKAKNARMFPVEEYANSLIAEGEAILKNPKIIDSDGDSFVDAGEMLKRLLKKFIYSRMD